MNTTLLFIELLITGLQGSTWVFLLVLSISGYGWLQTQQLQNLGDWSALLTVFVLSFAYAIGIIIDRLADTIFNKWNKQIGKQILPDIARPSIRRFALGKENEYLNNQFEYTRSRIRIVRASSLNFALIAIFATIFIWIQLQFLSIGQKLIYTLIILVGGGLLSGFSIYAWLKLTQTYYRLIQSNYKELS
ncbi:hypothetical protein H6G00_21210 [Leptolyngbya sp. FACHB-541]|uniref:hypothetical protein n=1 Tax=Leptolyngbya sp. FACHB-541 TaxID=2692810 RepID=UPI00168578AE|nr:hypothetical protein [Leptolyngbya sp. FACHB-541]MBD1999103.1 hypothetical protein [Leptolyngbya sp. FACHB-541]